MVQGVQYSTVCPVGFLWSGEGTLATYGLEVPSLVEARAVSGRVENLLHGRCEALGHEVWLGYLLIGSRLRSPQTRNDVGWMTHEQNLHVGPKGLGVAHHAEITVQGDLEDHRGFRPDVAQVLLRSGRAAEWESGVRRESSQHCKRMCGVMEKARPLGRSGVGDLPELADGRWPADLGCRWSWESGRACRQGATPRRQQGHR